MAVAFAEIEQKNISQDNFWNIQPKRPNQVFKLEVVPASTVQRRLWNIKGRRVVDGDVYFGTVPVGRASKIQALQSISANLRYAQTDAQIELSIQKASSALTLSSSSFNKNRTSLTSRELTRLERSALKLNKQIKSDEEFRKSVDPEIAAQVAEITALWSQKMRVSRRIKELSRWEGYFQNKETIDKEFKMDLQDKDIIRKLLKDPLTLDSEREELISSQKALAKKLRDNYPSGFLNEAKKEQSIQAFLKSINRNPDQKTEVVTPAGDEVPKIEAPSFASKLRSVFNTTVQRATATLSFLV